MINKIKLFWYVPAAAILFCLGWLGFLGADHKFFPDGGLIGRIITFFKRKKSL